MSCTNATMYSTDDSPRSGAGRQAVALDVNSVHGLRARLCDAPGSQYDDVMSIGGQRFGLVAHAHILRIGVVLQRHHNPQRPSAAGSALVGTEAQLAPLRRNTTGSVRRINRTSPHNDQLVT